MRVRHLTGLALALTLLPGLAACGGGSGPESEEPAGEAT